MNHPSLDALTADAGDLTEAEDREGVREHLDACPACLDLYSSICAERAVIEYSRPSGGLGRPLAIAGVVVLAAGAAWLTSGALRTPTRSPHESIRLLASPDSRAQAAAELLRMGPSALAALERGSREDDATISRACQDLLHMIAAQDPADTRTLVSAVEEKWKSIREAATEGNLWVDKKDFSAAYEEWKKANRPDEAALKAAEAALTAWFEARAKEKGLEWRVRRLLCECARDRKDLKAAADQLDRAIAAYPDVLYRDPAKQSKFQHLINDRAMTIWDDKGADAAVDYAAELLAKDPRFHYFWAEPWDHRFHEDKQKAARKKMIDEIRTAYAERAKQHPDFAERSRKYAAELE